MAAPQRVIHVDNRNRHGEYIFQHRSGDHPPRERFSACGQKVHPGQQNVIRFFCNIYQSYPIK